MLEKRVSLNLGILKGGGGGRENWSKLLALGGQFSTLALILEGEMYLISFWQE